MSSALEEWLSTTEGVSADTSGCSSTSCSGEKFCIEMAKAEALLWLQQHGLLSQ